MNDFTGFLFNGIHSSTYHLYRVSDGNRYNENLLPTLQDKTVQVPGSDGTYYFGSYYTERSFTLKFAYNAITESDMRHIKQWLNGKEVSALIFDEEPYKTYYAKCSGSPQFQYICFEISGARVYKGEGEISFTCFEPFGRCSHKYLSDSFYNDYDNVNEWKDGAGLLATKGEYDGNGATIKLYNPGDKETNFCAYYSGNSTLTQISIGTNQLNLSAFTLRGIDNGFRINSSNHLIEGIKNGQLTGNIYNDYIVNGDFFKIPLIDRYTTVNYVSTGQDCSQIQYDYLYL